MIIDKKTTSSFHHNDYELKDIYKDLIGPNQLKPIVIDFWAPWCGPCKQLSPIIKKIASKANRRWGFITINIDNHQQIAMQFGVKSIPVLKMMYENQIVAELVGVHPESEVCQWLKKNLPKDFQNSEAPPPIWEKEFHQAIKNNRIKAKKVLKKAYLQQKDQKLLSLLAMLSLPNNVDEAKGYLSQITKKEIDIAVEQEVITTIEKLRYILSSPSALEGEDAKLQKTYYDAILHLFNQEYEKALDFFIIIMTKNRSFNNDGARKACVAIFCLLTEFHPMTKIYRRRFSMALY